MNDSERINANIQFTNYSTMGAQGKKLLYEKQSKAINFCKGVGRNIPSIKRKFTNVTNKKTLDEITNTVFDYCSKLPSEQDIGQKGIYVDYLLGLEKYYSNVKRSTSPTLKFMNEDPTVLNGTNSGASTPKALNSNMSVGEGFKGGRRRKTKSQGKRGKRLQRKRITRRK